MKFLNLQRLVLPTAILLFSAMKALAAVPVTLLTTGLSFANEALARMSHRGGG